jgi:high-affinity iron transporter
VAETGSAWALGLLAFSAVGREGLETALFLVGSFQASGAAAGATGALTGLAVAVALGYALHSGSLRLNIQRFFQVSGALLVVFGAGLLAYSIHELIEAGLVPALVENIWDTNGVLDDKTGVGLMLKSLLGYNGNPALTEVLAYVSYLAACFWATRFTTRPARWRRSATVRRPAASA